MPMIQPSSYADHMKLWQHRLRAMGENADDFADQESRRTRLEGIINEVNQVIHEQSAATAAKQDASRRVEALMAEGRNLSSFLNACIRQKYGNTSEKLAEFLLQPFRGRQPKDVTPPPAPEASE